MKRILLILTMLLSTLGSQAIAEDREVIQQELDQACEAARLEKLTPIRQKYAAQCVADRGRSAEYCERFYSDYGDGGGQTSLFYDLPECEKAWDYLTSQRRAD